MRVLSFVLFPERACKKLLTMVSVREGGNAEGSFTFECLRGQSNNSNSEVV